MIKDTVCKTLIPETYVFLRRAVPLGEQHDVLVVHEVFVSKYEQNSILATDFLARVELSQFENSDRSATHCGE